MEQTPNNLTPTQTPPIGNDFFQVQPSAPSFLQKHGTLIFISGIIISIILIIVGIILQVTYKPAGVSDRSIETVQNELSELSPKISDATTKQQSIFAESGFSDAFFAANNTLTDLEFQRDSLQQELDELIAAQKSINVFTTGAFYFFLSAFILLVIVTILFIISRRTPQSNSSIIN